MWQEFRNDVAAQGVEIVTVGLDAAGAEACRPFIEAASPEHPSLIDEHHRVAELFGVINIPNAVWIDEQGMIVRPAEAAPGPPSFDVGRDLGLGDMSEIPERMLGIMGEASKIQADPAGYEAAMRDWITNGTNSRFALTPDEVIERSGPRSQDHAIGHAHFELATHFETTGNHAAAVEHFKKAHELVPENFAYRRQAWSLEPSVDGPLARFWQGPSADNPDAWPYAGDWLTDVKAMGAENYYPAFEA